MRGGFIIPPQLQRNILRRSRFSTLRVRVRWAYDYGRIRRMKTFNVDVKLFAEAKAACGAATDTETVRLGLEALVRHAAYERLRILRGAEPDARDVRRRRSGDSPIGRPEARHHPINA